MKFRTAEKEVWPMGAVHRLCKLSQWHYSSAESMRVLSWISIRPHSAQAAYLETDIKKKKSPKLKPVRRLPLSSIYDGRFDSSELPPWTAALIVLECGLMDVGLEIKEIHPLRFCLIFKRHLTFLSGVSSLSWMSAREDGPAVVTVGCTRGQAGLKARARVNFRIESSLCFNNRKSTPKLSGLHTHTHTHRWSLQGEICCPFSLSGKTVSPIGLSRPCAWP